MNTTRVVKALAVAVAVPTLFFAGQSTASESNPSIPACEYEDGSTQQVCVWDGRNQGNKTGDVIVNVDWGNWSYNLSDNGMTDHTQEG